MGLTYIKRFRMEVDLAERDLSTPPMPPGYSLIPWDPILLRSHAETKFESFRFEMDVHVFPCLGDRNGCYNLMTDITRKESFVPTATWLAAYRPENGDGRLGAVEFCGTIQGLRDPRGVGSIQNIGVTPAHRGKNIGSAMIVQSLAGFRQAGLNRVYLEVTAQNDAAVRLYQRLGFVKTRIVYKAIEVAEVCS